jgi:hypothetical protein
LTLEGLIENTDETINSLFRWLGLDYLAAIEPLGHENVIRTSSHSELAGGAF